MADAKFTAGPWQRKSDYEPTIIIGNVDGETHPDGSSSYSYDFIANLEDEYGGSPPNAYANAALILAAPELYAALMAIHNMLWGRPDIVNKLRPLMGFAEEAISNQCAAALAKARGDQ